MAKLFFSKANINEKIYEVYRDTKKINYYKNNMFNLVKDDTIVEIEEPFYYENVEGEKNKETRLIPYGFLNIIKDDINKTIVGSVIKYSKRSRTEVREKQVVNISDKYDIPISFYFDINREIVMYSTKINFGHIDFTKAFEELINKSIDEEEVNFKFEVIKNSSSVIERISRFKKVLEIKSEFIPPNPNEEEFEELFGRESDSFKEANIKKVTTIIEGGKDGINTDTLEVKRAIYASALGYGNVEVKGLDDNDVYDNFSDKQGMPITIDYPSSKARSPIDLKEDGESFVMKIANIRKVAKEEIKAFINSYYEGKKKNEK